MQGKGGHPHQAESPFHEQRPGLPAATHLWSDHSATTILAESPTLILCYQDFLKAGRNVTVISHFVPKWAKFNHSPFNMEMGKCFLANLTRLTDSQVFIWLFLCTFIMWWSSSALRAILIIFFSGSQKLVEAPIFFFLGGGGACKNS